MLRPILSVIIPASNEEDWILDCLAAVFSSNRVPGGAEVIVVANGCHDRTAEFARSLAPSAGWDLKVIELRKGSKPLALNAGDRAARGPIRAYLDADCQVSPGVFAGLVAALSAETAPAYASATPVIPRPQSAISRHYARFWQALPFNQTPAPGYGLYAVNAAGRARWEAFPDLISDDSFTRLQFLPHERIQISAPYLWPMIEGFSALVRVRARQNRGMAELAKAYPALLEREAKPRLGLGRLLRLAARDPLGFLSYAAVILRVKLMRVQAGFTRGR